MPKSSVEVRAIQNDYMITGFLVDESFVALAAITGHLKYHCRTAQTSQNTMNYLAFVILCPIVRYACEFCYHS